MAGITGLIGSFFGSDTELYGSRPKVPDFPDYMDQLRKTIQGNISLIPSLSDLASQSTDLYQKLMEQANPGVTAMKATSRDQIQAMLQGEIPKDVERNLRQYAAEGATAGGYSGSSFASNQVLRNLGLTSLDLVNRGLDSASRWIAQAQNQTFDFSRMFLGPQDAIRQAEGNWSRNWLASQVAAAPDPSVRGAYDSEMALIGMVLSAYSGGAGYTQQYRSPYQGGGGGGYGGGGGGYGGGGGGQSYFGGGGGNEYQGQGFSAADEAAGAKLLGLL